MDSMETLSTGNVSAKQSFVITFNISCNRPYGFGAWGYGSTNYGIHRIIVSGPNFYGGFHPSG